MINIALIVLALHGGGVLGFRLRATNNPAICLQLTESSAASTLNYQPTTTAPTYNLQWTLADCDYSTHLGIHGQRFTLDEIPNKPNKYKLEVAGYVDSTGAGKAEKMRVYLDSEALDVVNPNDTSIATGDWGCHRDRVFVYGLGLVASKKFLEFPVDPATSEVYDGSSYTSYASPSPNHPTLPFMDTAVDYDNKYIDSFVADEEICPLNPGKNIKGIYLDQHKNSRGPPNLEYDGVPGPNIIVIMIDDLGWHDLGVRNMESRTPNMDFLSQTGIQLDRHYGYKTGTQSRASFMFGREPAFMGYKEGANPDTEMNSIAHVLKIGGYKTTFFGKWSLGFHSRSLLPYARGFDYSFCTFGNADLWEQASPASEDCSATSSLIDRPVGLWEDNQGNGSPAYGQNGTYTDDIVFAKANKYMQDHVDSQSQSPFFMLISTKNVSPDPDVHQTYFDRMAHVRDPTRRRHLAQVAYVDDRIGELVSSTRQNGINANTLIVVLSDNGAPSDLGNNYPLRGGRGVDTDGGVRTTAFVNGGSNVIQSFMRGTKRTGLMHISDWYRTFASLAGVTGVNQAALVDPVAQANGMPALGGYDMWDYIRGKDRTAAQSPVTVSPRTMVTLSPYPEGPNDVPTGVGLIWHKPGGSIYKRILGQFSVAESTNYFFPNGTHPKIGTNNLDCVSGCLFDLIQDKKEENDICASDTTTCDFLRTESDKLVNNLYHASILRKFNNPQACETATANGGYWGPFEAD